MSFKLQAEGEPRRVEWPVKVQVPVDGGRHRVEQFRATFEIPDLDRARDELGDGRDTERVRAFLGTLLVDWAEVTDDDGNEIPFSEQTRAAALRRHDVVEALAWALREILAGGRRKN